MEHIYKFNNDNYIAEYDYDLCDKSDDDEFSDNEEENNYEHEEEKEEGEDIESARMSGNSTHNYGSSS
jgi:hypothetical protein